MKTSPSASWRLNCTRFIGLPASPLVRLFSLPRLGRLSPSSSSASAWTWEVMNRLRAPGLRQE